MAISSGGITDFELDPASVIITGGTINGTTIGATTPSTGAFTTLSASGAVSGLGFSAYLASPPAIGGTVAAAGTFTVLTATAAVALSPADANIVISPTGTGLVTINPATAGTINNVSIGVTTAAAGRFTQVTSTVTTGTAPLVVASTTVVANLNASTLGGATFAAPGVIGGTTPAAGTFTTLTATGAVALSPASANVVLSPTGTGVVTINPATLGTLDKVTVGGTTPAAGTFTTLADSLGSVRKVPHSGSDKVTGYTLLTSDVGQYVSLGASGGITIPDATFAAGDIISLFNNTTGNITITGTITTCYLAGTDADKATLTLATRGVATILFLSGTVCVVSGNVS